MRRIVTFDRVSADGYFTASDGDLSWTVPEPELDRAAREGMANGPGTLLFGRRTYDMFEGFWPHVLDDGDTAPDPHAAGRRSPELRAMATWLDEATKIVFSRERADVTWRNSRLVRELDPREIAAMKAADGGDIMVFGSGTLVSQLAAHDLVDEYRFVVGPVLLGAGRPLVEQTPMRLPLALIEATAYPQGNVVLRYARAR